MTISDCIDMEKHFGLQTFLHNEKSNSKHVNDVAVVTIHWYKTDNNCGYLKI